MIAISHPEKVLFPDDGITKGDMAVYYEAIAPIMLPHIRGRPVTMERYHRGIGTEGFFQKSIAKGAPEWLERVTVPKKGGVVNHPLVNDARSLLWLANQNCITPHVWVSRVPHLYQPDLCVFDLDPMRDDAEEVREAALALRALLTELGLKSWIKTTGSKGFHIAVPLGGTLDAGTVSGFAHAVGTTLVARHPRTLTMEFSKADRDGRIYVDTGRNHPPATFACAYAVRARRSAPISAPCTWAEVESGAVQPTTVTITTITPRITRLGDVWADMHNDPQPLDAAIEQLRSST